MLAVVSGTAGNAVADPKDFVLKPLAFIGAPAPGGTFFGVFESNVINNRGDVLFGSNLTTEDEAGVFLLRRGVPSKIARTGDTAPGGGVFVPPGFLSPITLNDRGDVAFAFLLNAFVPVSLNAGLYRFSSSAHRVSPVVIPGVTQAPGGVKFAGAGFGASLNDRGDLVFAGILPTNQGLPFPEQQGLGQGLFRARRNGAIASVVSPGDAAPAGIKHYEEHCGRAPSWNMTNHSRNYPPGVATPFGLLGDDTGGGEDIIPCEERQRPAPVALKTESKYRLGPI